MRILVTGASGLLGLNLALEASQEHEVYGSVNQNVIRTKAFTVIQSNLTAQGAVEQLIDDTNPDWVINCAALANIDTCESEPELAKKLNIDLPEKLANYVARGGARMVHISTDAVFDGTRGDYTEDDQPNPLSVYAQTKLKGEHSVMAANAEAVVARVNLFGWSLSGKRSLAEWFFNNLSAGNSIMGFTDVYFCPLFVNDLAKLILEMLERKFQGLYHVVSSECSNKYNFGVRIARLFDFDHSLIKPASVSESGLKASRSNNLTLKTDKLAHQLRRSIPDLSSGLEKFHQQYQEGIPQFIRRMGA